MRHVVGVVAAVMTLLVAVRWPSYVPPQRKPQVPSIKGWPRIAPATLMVPGGSGCRWQNEATWSLRTISVPWQTLMDRPMIRPEAVSWYAKAAAGGYTVAQHNLAVMYEKGRGVAQDYGLARRWYGAAAAQGDAEAMTNLGLMQYRGQGGAKDPKAAIETFTRAAKLGSVKAAYDLGTLLEHGDGVAADPTSAASWYRQAADGNYARCAEQSWVALCQGQWRQAGFRDGD